MADDRRYVLIGTAGHIDHGKTALVKMLTGCDTDTLKEEKERGLTIDLGFAPCEMRGDLMACLVDVPGHEKFIRNMVAGASGIDAVLLVVAANDSVMPQTVEHLRIVELLGITRGLVAVTKIDMVDDELRELVVEEVRDFLQGTFLEDAPICPVSSVTGEGIDGLWTALAEVVDACRDRPVQGIFRMPVERVFSLAGFGTVITGMPSSGRLRVGEKLELLPQGETGRLRGLQVYGKTSDTGWAGQCLAMNVVDVDYNTVERGNVLATPGYLESARMLEARLALLPGAERPLKHQAPVRFHTGTSEVIGRMFLIDRDFLAPGDSAFVQFRAEDPLVVAPGDRFVIRQYSPVVTIGGGRILRSSRRKVKRFREGIVEELEALDAALDDEKRFVLHLLRRAGARPVRAEDLMRQAMIPVARLRELLDELAEDGEGRSLGGAHGAHVSAEALRGIAAQVEERLAAFHEETPLRAGLELHDLRKKMGVDGALVDAALAALEAEGKVRRIGPHVALASHAVEMSAGEQALADELVKALEEAGVSPPSPAQLATDRGRPVEEIEKLLRALVDRGTLVALGDDRFAHAEGEKKARELLVGHLREHGQIGVVDYRDLLGASRKFVYAWLDHFDAKGVTYRVENLRYLRSS